MIAPASIALQDLTDAEPESVSISMIITIIRYCYDNNIPFLRNFARFNF